MLQGVNFPVISETTSVEWFRDVLPLAAAVALATIQKIWSSHQRRQLESWPIAYGLITSAEGDIQANTAILKLHYSYRVANERYSGSFNKVFEDSREMYAWKDALSGKQVSVRYNSNHPARSRLSETDLQPIVQAFVPALSPPTHDQEPLTWWRRVACQFGLGFGIVAFGACVLQLVSEQVGKPLLGRSAYALLTAAAVPFGAISFFIGYGKTKDTWRAVPSWMKFLGFVVLYYSMFAILPILPHSKRSQRARETGKDISYQLAVYFGTIEVFYARLRSDKRSDDSIRRSLHPDVTIG